MADHAQSPSEQGTRRDFLFLTAASVTAFGAASAVWPFVSSMNPSKDVLALSSIEVDVGQVAEGQAITVKWRGKPVFIRHRTADEIALAVKDDAADMKDPQIWSWSVSAPISAACRWGRRMPSPRASSAVGIAPVTARNTTRPAVSAKVPRRSIWRFRPTSI